MPGNRISGTPSAKRIATIVAIGTVLVVVAAWIDGGEEPLRDITQPVELPEGVL